MAMTIRSWLLVALGVVLATFSVARAVGGVEMGQTMVQVFGYPDPANSPAPVTTATNAVAARTASDLPQYSLVRILCTQNAYYLMGGSSVTVTSSTGVPIAAWVPEVVRMGNSSASNGTAYKRISFILDSATSGTCYAILLR